MAAVALCGLLLAAQGCGKTEETAPAAETAAEETAASEEGPVEAEETEASQEETMEAETQEETESPEPETIQSDETYPGTMAAAEEDSTFQYGVMYATVVDVQNEEDGSTLYSLQDSNDPENVWTLSSLDIGSISTEMEKGVRQPSCSPEILSRTRKTYISSRQFPLPHITSAWRRGLRKAI